MALPTTSLAAAFSVRLAVSGYAGSCLRLRRVSDNAEQDIGFSGGWLDTAAAAAFLGGSSGRVTTWYDQTGNGRHLTQATAANQCIYVADRDGRPAVLNSLSASHSFAIPATLTLNGRDAAVWVVGNSMYMGSAALTIPNYTGLLRTNVVSTARLTLRSVSRVSDIELTLTDALYGLNLSAASCAMHSTEGSFAAAAQVANTGSGGTFAAWGYARELVFYTATQSAGDVTALKADQTTAFSLRGTTAAWDGQICFDGDSIPTGTGLTGEEDSYPRQFNGLAPSWRGHVFSTSGATTDTLTTRQASVNLAVDATVPENILHVHVGINNIGSGGLNQDAATAYSAIVTLIGNYASAGWNKILVGTVLACEPLQTKVDDLNARLRGTTGNGLVADVGSAKVRLVDYAALPEFNDVNDSNNLTYYQAGDTHPTHAGNTKLAERLALEPEFAAAPVLASNNRRRLGTGLSLKL